MQDTAQNGRFPSLEVSTKPESPATQPNDESFHPYYLNKDAVKQHGVLNRTLSSLNPFKVRTLRLLTAVDSRLEPF